MPAICTATKYPRIHRGYWGQQPIKNFIKQHGQDSFLRVIMNRDVFAEEYCVVPSAIQHKFKHCIPTEFDHLEIFRCKDGRCIMLISPYANPTMVQTLRDCGFMDYHVMYSPDTVSMIRVFDSLKNMTFFMKDCTM